MGSCYNVFVYTERKVKIMQYTVCKECSNGNFEVLAICDDLTTAREFLKNYVAPMAITHPCYVNWEADADLESYSCIDELTNNNIHFYIKCRLSD